ncbi:MAG: hypothetical protein Q7U91_03415 [Sideroxyarcus sp.]|nr:hypothetical protein [Sideroxyarcus sp.]
MNLKFVVSVVLVGGVLLYSGVKPSEALEQGGEWWDKFSGDFMAIFNVGSEDKVAKDASAYVGAVTQAICNSEPAVADEESAAIARDINRERCENAKNANAIVLDPEALKQHLQDRKAQLE